MVSRKISKRNPCLRLARLSLLGKPWCREWQVSNCASVQAVEISEGLKGNVLRFRVTTKLSMLRRHSKTRLNSNKRRLRNAGHWKRLFERYNAVELAGDASHAAKISSSNETPRIVKAQNVRPGPL